MTKFVLTIYNADGSTYWVENFETKLALNTWLKEEQSRPYWKKDFKVEVTDNTEAIEKARAELNAENEALELARAKSRADAKLAVKAFKDKPSKNVADVVKLLEALVDMLDLKPDDTAKG
jgi:hypothetical protein